MDASLAQRAIDVIRHRATEPDLRLSDVAQSLATNTQRLSRQLRRTTGQGFWAHLSDERCRIAASLLHGRETSVKQIAVIVGFRRTSQLDMAFKARFGTTPSTFRKHIVS